jgi:hypothetical protein
MQQASTLTTMDIDLLVPDKNKVKTGADVPEILKRLNFIEDPKINGLIKYENADLGLDFLTELKGKEQKDVIEIEKLKINAEPLRFMDILGDNNINVHFDNLEINIPEPAAFVLNKFITSQRRPKKEKREKDIKTAKEYYYILIKDENERKKLKDIFNGFPKGWQNTLKKIFLENGIDKKDFE